MLKLQPQFFGNKLFSNIATTETTDTFSIVDHGEISVNSAEDFSVQSETSTISSVLSQHCSIPMISSSESQSDSHMQHICRICLQGNAEMSERLISPCHCSGTIHKSCLERWLSTSNRKQCEVCKFVFKTKTSNPNLFKYLWNERSVLESIADILCFILFASLFISGSVLVLGLGFSNYNRSIVAEVNTIAFVVLFFIFLLVLYVCMWWWWNWWISSHKKHWQKFKNTYRIIRIQ